MRRAALSLVVVLAGLAVAGGIAKRVLLDSAEAPWRASASLDLDELRGLARMRGGELPLRIASELIGESTLPAFAVLAGRGLGPHPVVQTAFQVVYAAGYGIIDTAFDREIAREIAPDGSFHVDRFQVLQRALPAADWIVVTHEHADHLGGIGRATRRDQVLPRVVLTRAQAENREELAHSRLDAIALEEVRVIPLEDAFVLAPGVVLLPAPGHTPGSQLVYVLCQDGSEFLFVGDVVWDRDNIDELVGRPRLVSDWLLDEDREAVLDQLRMLHDFARRFPEVELVIAHDADDYRRLLRSGRIGDGFELEKAE